MPNDLTRGSSNRIRRAAWWMRLRAGVAIVFWTVVCVATAAGTCAAAEAWSSAWPGTQARSDDAVVTGVLAAGAVVAWKSIRRGVTRWITAQELIDGGEPAPPWNNLNAVVMMSNLVVFVLVVTGHR